MSQKRRAHTSQQRTAILVLGMHRSGTSALARVLNLLGAAAPRTLMPADPTNPRGFWESNKLVPIHEEMLASMGSAWDDWPPVDGAWSKSVEASAYAARLSEAIGQEFADAPLFVVKDPRLCRLLPIWLGLLREMNVRAVGYHIIRNPLEVAHSLKLRDGFPLEKSLLLWLRHVLDAEKESRSLPRGFLSYEGLLADWQAQLDRSGKTTGAAWPETSAAARVEISQFLAPDLYHNQATHADLKAHPNVPTWVTDAYACLRKLMSNPRDAEAQSGLDEVKKSFDLACAAFSAVSISRRPTATERNHGLSVEEERADAAEAALREKNKELDRAAADARTAQARAQQLDSALQSEAARAADLASRVQSAESEAVRVSAGLATATKRVAEIEAALAQAGELAKQAERFQSEILRLDAKLSEATTQSARLRSDLRESTLETQRSLSRIADLEGALTRSDSTIEHLRAGAIQLQARVDQLIDRQVAAQADQARASAALSAAIDRADRFGATLEAKESELRRSEAERESLRASVGEYEADLGKKQSQIAELKAALSRSAAQLVDVQARVNAMDERARRHEATLAEERARREALETREQAAVLRADARERDLRAATAKIDELEARLGSWTGLTRSMFGRATGRPKQNASSLGRSAPSLREQVRIIEKAGLFDRDWYLARNADVRGSGSDPLAHYVEFGWKESRDPSAHFSTVEYLEGNADVRAASICPLYHYAVVGRLEKRAPRRGSAVEMDAPDIRDLVAVEFDSAFYRSRYANVLKLGQDPLDHFLMLGWRRGLDPNAQFSVADYLRNYPDVRAAGINPYVHYLLAGRREGRVPRNEPHHDEEYLAQRRVIAAEFDVAFYLDVNPEVRQAQVDPVAHFLSEGWREGRDPSAAFSTRYYLATHADVREAGINPFYHFLVAGRSEGRTPRATENELKRREVRDAIATAFDADYYLAVNPDVADAGLNPLDHYVDNGWAERRNPTPLFSTGYYLDANSDVAAAGVNPFYHYLVAGKNEGRKPAHPGGWRANALARLTSVERQIEDATAASVEPSKLLTLADLVAKLEAVVGMSNRHLVVAISHDDYTTSVGGVQLCLNLEERFAREQRTIYLNLHPATALPFLSRERNPRALAMTVVCNGDVLGAASAAIILNALRAVRPKLAVCDLVVHSLLGHSPEVIAEIHRALSVHRALFWVHDFFGLCPSYTLLRNGISYCGAPPVGSAACSVCVFGEERASHLRRMRDMLAVTPFEIVAPSSFAADYWRSHANVSYQKLIVQPHCVIESEVVEQPPTCEGAARIAYLGHPSPHKGWETFVRLVDAMSDDPRYEFHHFGAGRKCLRGAAFTRVSVLEDGPGAMIEALRTRAIDAAILWSIWPETFSFVAHEAIAADALILTCEESGNIAKVARAPSKGLVFQGEDDLESAFSRGLIHDLIAARRGRPRAYGMPRFSRMSFELLDAERERVA